MYCFSTDPCRPTAIRHGLSHTALQSDRSPTLMRLYPRAGNRHYPPANQLAAWLRHPVLPGSSPLPAEQRNYAPLLPNSWESRQFN